uniref:M-phase inducer phosphatase n=1 Tax=Crassostrea virginica TaxID=6565 RepID=A0A8B8E647_CRAVI|nr:M-phase inducer phosphatase-like [Crassostrea virginica]
MHIPSNLDVDLDYVPLPKLTLFDDDENYNDSGLGMEECALEVTSSKNNRPSMIKSLIERPFAKFSESPSIETRRSTKRTERRTETNEESLRKRPKFTERKNILKKSLSFGDNPLGDDDEIKAVVGRMVEESNLTGDGSQTCSLPTIPGKHSDLRSITNETVVDVISGKYDDSIGSVLIVDCRYPYEYDGGHVPGSINAYRPDDVQFILDQHQRMRDEAEGKRHIVIFYCEFSSERGPRMCRNVRKADRNHNMDRYPFLNFPELYIMHNGFKAFFETHQNVCEPQGYTPMLHKDHSDDLRHFRSRSKSWNGGSKRRAFAVRFKGL